MSIGVLVLRVTEPDRPRPFKVPFVWPVALLEHRRLPLHHGGPAAQAWERFGLWLAIGLLIYVFYGYRHSRLRTLTLRASLSDPRPAAGPLARLSRGS